MPDLHHFLNHLIPALLLPLIVTIEANTSIQLNPKLPNTPLPIPNDTTDTSNYNGTAWTRDSLITVAQYTDNKAGVSLTSRKDVDFDSESDGLSVALALNIHSDTESSYTPEGPSFISEDSKLTGTGEDLENSTYSKPQMDQDFANETKARLRQACNETIGCIGNFVQCRNGHCKCQHELVPDPNDMDSCTEPVFHTIETPHTDPTMIGVVIGLALMSVTLCVVMRLFAKARFRENRTIFNTANPRLMNVTSKKIAKQASGPGNLSSSGIGSHRARRGSQASLQSGDCSSEHSSHPTGHPHVTQLRARIENGTEPVAGSSTTDRGPLTDMELQMKKFERLEAAGHM